MAFATLIIKTNIGEVTATPLWYIARYILRLDKKTFAVFILSQIGGYPVGVRLLSELYGNDPDNSRSYSKHLCYCYNSGPAFVTGIVGIGVYNDVTAGIIVFISCLTANFLAAVVMNIRNTALKPHRTKINFSSSDISDSLNRTARAMLNIILPILLFNCVTELAGYLLYAVFNMEIPDFLKAVTEITNIKTDGVIFSLPITSALISFGGFCVIYQIFSLADFTVNKLYFIFSRILISAVSAGVCCLILQITGYEPAADVFAYAADILLTDPLLLMCIAAMTFILLKSTGKMKKI